MSGKSRLLIDLRVSYRDTERGIPNYAIQLALAVARTARFDCLFLGHKFLPELKAQAELQKFGEMIWFEDFLMTGYPPIDAFLMTSVAYGFENASDIVRYIIPACLLAQKPALFCILYDLIPLKLANRYLSNSVIKSRYCAALKIIEACDHIFSISEASRRDALEHLDLKRECISTIPGGINVAVWRQSSVGKERSNEVVYIGGQDYRKNLEGLIRGFTLFFSRKPHTTLRLSVVCAMSKEVKSELRRTLGSSESRVTLTGYLSQDELVAKVAGARASIFPSFYEGLGLPILESYAVDTPVFGSNNSSITDLVIQGCHFDPTSDIAIAEAFEAIETRDDLLNASVAEGRKILARHTWPRTGSMVADTIGNLTNLRKGRAKSGRDRFIAVAGALAPEQTGIGNFNTMAFANCRQPIVFFSHVADRREAELKFRALGEYCRRPNLYPISEMPLNLDARDCTAAVFVLGNSKHNNPSLQMAIRLRAFKLPKVAYLHEANFVNLLLAHCNDDMTRLVERLAELYPEIEAGIDPMRVGGARLLMTLIGDVDIVVNSRRCADLIRRDLSGFATPKIEVIFHPIFEHPIFENGSLGALSDGVFRIGHFGHFSPLKSPELVLAAAERIAKTRPTRLVFAGYGCDGLQPICGNSDLIDWVNAPSDEKLIDLIRAVDVVVQPREFDHGESSGVICQAISAGKIPVTSAGTAADELESLVATVPRGKNVDAWVDAILQAERRQALGGPSFDHLSIEAFGYAFEGAVGRAAQNR